MALQDRSDSTAKKSPSTLLPADGDVPYYARRDAPLKEGPSSLLPEDAHRKKAQEEVVAVSPASLLPEAPVALHAQPRQELAAISPSELLPPPPPRQLPAWINIRTAGGAVAVLLVLSIAYFLHSQLNQKTAPELMQEAVNYLSQDNRTAAVIQLKNALTVDPDHIESRLLHGKLILDAGEPRVAEEEFRRALELGAKRQAVLPLLAKALIARKEYQEALDATAPAPGEDPTKQSAELIAIRGHALLFLGRTEQAREAYQAALAAESGQPEALLGKARIAVIERNQEQALKNIERSVAESPNNADALALLADLTRVTGNESGAAETYEKAVKLAPNNHAMRVSLASIYVSAKNYDKAVAHLQEVLKTQPENVNANFLMAIIEFRRQKFTEARNLGAKALAVQGNHVASLLMVGASSFAIKDYITAEKALRRALTLDPRYPVARKMLGASLVRLKRTQEGIDELQPLLKRAPKDPELLATLGEAYLDLRQYTRATEYLEQAAALSPTNAAARLSLGKSRLAANDLERAVADFEAAQTLAPQGTGAAIMLAMAHLKRNEFDRAASVLAAAEPERRKNPLLYNLLGAAHIGKKDFKLAVKDFERALKIAPDYLPAVLNLAQLDLRDKDPFSAARRLREFLKQNPNNMQAMFALAGVLAGMPDSRGEAENLLERAQQVNPDSPEPLIQLARYHLARGATKEALAAADRGLQRKIMNPTVLDEIGRLQIQARAYRKALDTYVRMTAENPKLPLAHYRLAVVQNETGNSAGARLSLREALKLQPEFTEAKVQLAQLEARAGNLSAALQIAEEFQKQFPKDPLGLVMRGDAFAVANRMKDAIPAYEAAYAMKKTDRLVVKLHQAHAQIGKIDRGEAVVDAWLRENPDDRATRQFVADHAMNAGRYVVARGHYEWLARAMPKNQQVANNLAIAYDKLNDPRALEFAERAYQLNPRNPYAADTFGWMLVRLGRPERGRDILKEAVAHAPNVPDLRHHYAVALAKSGQRKDARFQIERAFSLDGKLSDEAAAKALLSELKG